MRFEGKVVAVVGASRGIGEGLARRFAREGASLCLAADEEQVHAVGSQLSKLFDIKVFSQVLDVTSRTEVNTFYSEINSRFAHLDVSVHNAGVITIAKIEDMTEEEWDKVLAVNTKGVFLCSQAAARLMLAQNSGVILNTASGQAREGFIYTPHYAASKMGVVGITQSLAKELAPRGIRVNAFCPGIIESDMWVYNDQKWGELLGNYKQGELMAEWVKNIPLGRAGKAEDVAGLVSFLASEDAGYITGQTINVDGGLIFS